MAHFPILRNGKVDVPVNTLALILVEKVEKEILVKVVDVRITMLNVFSKRIDKALENFIKTEIKGIRLSL